MTAVAAFAQIIPVLFVAAFLSNVRIGHDPIARVVAMIYIAAGAIAEGICIACLAFDKAPGTFLTATVFAITAYMLIALVATAFAKLKEDAKESQQ